MFFAVYSHECLDQLVIVGEAHLRRVLAAYSAYYNRTRTHLALEKNAVLGGLHHQYVRI
jgi:hypothetical protein